MMKATADSAWCDSVPSDAYSVSRWASLKDGEKRPVKVSVVLGTIDCSSL